MGQTDVEDLTRMLTGNFWPERVLGAKRVLMAVKEAA
jgi:hypothetical protein